MQMLLWQKRFIHSSNFVLKSEGKRPTSWDLPDLDKLPGGFRGKVYNKRNWTEYLSKNTQALQKEEEELSKTKRQVKPPPSGWRKRKDLPQWLRNKYALKEKAMKMDLSDVKKLSPTAAKGIRILHDQFPADLPNEKLAEFFKVSPVAIAKILKSRWKPTEEESKKIEKRWERNINKTISKKMVDSKFTEFIEETERKLKMEIPPFLKLELKEHYDKHGIDHIKDEVNELNEARIAKEKIKDEKLSGYINNMVDGTKTENT